jgi:hypothetical protein
VGVYAHQDRVFILEHLIEGADVDGGEILALVVSAGRFHGGVDDVGDRADGHAEVEDVAEELNDPAERTVAAEDQAEDDLAQLGLGDVDGEQDLLFLIGLGCESVVESLLGLAGLLIDEFPADVVFVGEVAEGLCASESFDGEALSFVMIEAVGGARSVVGEGPLGAGGGRIVVHVCFLLKTGLLQ